MKKILTILIATSLVACSGSRIRPDASGTFEADEVIVSSEVPGKILSFKVEEGSTFAKDSVVGTIDPTQLSLQHEQVTATISALSLRTADVSPQLALLRDQLAVQQAQLKSLERERKRTENLLKLDAATGKQLDDINSQIDVLQKQIAVTSQQINVQRNAYFTQNRGILSEAEPLRKKAAQLKDQLDRTNITNPVSGTVLATYAEAGEVVSSGKALYKIADLSTVNLRAYLTGNLLSATRLGQQVTVLVDSAEGNYKRYPGQIIWISDKAEFTPKTIQTKDERANLVYAVKVKVINDGYLKLGMYGEILLNQK
jgi:HlyD family secretion protein